MKRALWLVLFFLYCTRLCQAKHFLRKVCRNALTTKDPLCLNGGVLHAHNLSDYKNCASCDCPDGWRGVDCGLCHNRASCPAKGGVQAINCTSGSIAPTEEEHVIGKSLSCYCGGDDRSTKYVCDQQPGTNWQLRTTSVNAEGFFNMTVIERAGIPSQDYHPSCDGYNPKQCPSRERYKFAASQVWNGLFMHCKWSRGACIEPLKGHDCLVYECGQVKVNCPPSFVKKCPGWTPFKCGNPTGEGRPYWMHHCVPITLPMEILPTTLACKESKRKDGRYQCYLSQSGSYFASIGLQCETGSCIYEDRNVSIFYHTKDDKSWYHWFDEHQAELLIALFWLFFIIVVTVAIIMIIKDKRRSKSRAEEWVNDAQNNIDEFIPPLLQTRPSQQDAILRQTLTLQFENIDYYVRIRGKKIRQVLRSVHGLAAPYKSHQDRIGSMLAIMGPSGAGKTSLLDILSGYRRVGVAGTVIVNDLHMKAGDRLMRKIAGYVQQDDVLPGTSTVFEYLLFNASLRMPSHVIPHEKEKRVFDVIQQLGLSKVSHSFVGDQFTRGISGGEKRRVSIACERLVGPKLVFLDEPTTGLDSTNAAKVVDILLDMAMNGITIVMSIHQPRPDLFRILDRTMLLSGIGQVIYSGPALEAENYFQTLGYASPRQTIHVMDYMLDVVIKTDPPSVDSMVTAFSQSKIHQQERQLMASSPSNTNEVPITKFRSSFFQQVRCLSTRLLRNTSRHPFLIALNLVANFVVALALGLLFHNTGHNTDGIQSRLGVLFFIVMFLSTMSLSSLPVWREERLLFKRERGNGVYGASSYFLSVLLFDLIPLRVLPPMFFVILSYWMIDLHKGCALCIVWFTLIVVLTNVVASLTSMTIGAATPTNAVANALGSLFVLVSLLFAGYFLNKDEMPKWCENLAHFSYLKWGYAGLVINEFKDAPESFVFTALIDNEEFAPIRIRGSMILCEFGFRPDRFVWDVLVLCIFGGACCLITYVILLVSGWDLTPSLNINLLRQHQQEAITAPLLDESSGVSRQQTSSQESWYNLELSMNIGENLPVQQSETPMVASCLTLSWHNVTCCVSTSLLHSDRIILHNISGIAGPSVQRAVPSIEPVKKSMLFAIMGPSGAGKTTLIDILAGRKRDIGVSGDIRVNGHHVKAQVIRRLSGYVLQDNVLPGTPTVYEHVMFHAQLRIPLTRSTAKEQNQILQAKVLDICQKLGLEKVLHNRIGDAYVRGLSGGERKRVSIACELLVDPGILFLDEPTSGLDSTNATQVIDILGQTAAAGVTVIMSIHQPRPTFFNLIDKIMMLSGEGQLVFTGCSALAEKHFEQFGYEIENKTVDVFDFVLDLIIKAPPETVRTIVDSFAATEAQIEDEEFMDASTNDEQSSSQSRSWKDILTSTAKYHASHFTQIKVLALRMGRNLYRHPLLLFVNFFSALFVSLMLGSVYWDTGMNTAGIQNRLGSLFFIITFLSFMSLSSLPLWHDDRLLFIRERAAGAYGTTSYFVANLLFDVLPMRVFPPCFFALFSYWMIGFNSSTIAVMRFLLIVVLCNVAASTFSLAVGALIESTSMANMVASLFILLANLLGGFFLSRKRLFSGLDKIVDIVSKLSFVRYAFDGLLLNEFHDKGGFELTASYRCIKNEGSKKVGVDVSGDEVLKTFGFPTSWHSFVVDIIALLCFIAVHALITFLLFKYKDRPGEASIWNRGRHKIRALAVLMEKKASGKNKYFQPSLSYDSDLMM